MKSKEKPLFDPKIFLAKSDVRTIADYKEHQLVFSQETRRTPSFIFNLSSTVVRGSQRLG